MNKETNPHLIPLTRDEASSLVTACIMCEGVGVADSALKSAEDKLVAALGLEARISGLRKQGIAELRQIIREETKN